MCLCMLHEILLLICPKHIWTCRNLLLSLLSLQTLTSPDTVTPFLRHASWLSRYLWYLLLKSVQSILCHLHWLFIMIYEGWCLALTLVEVRKWYQLHPCTRWPMAYAASMLIDHFDQLIMSTCGLCGQSTLRGKKILPRSFQTSVVIECLIIKSTLIVVDCTYFSILCAEILVVHFC